MEQKYQEILPINYVIYFLPYKKIIQMKWMRIMVDLEILLLKSKKFYTRFYNIFIKIENKHIKKQKNFHCTAPIFFCFSFVINNILCSGNAILIVLVLVAA